MSFSKPASIACLALVAVLFSGRAASAQSGGAALGYSSYALASATKAYNEYGGSQGTAAGDLALDGYNYAYYAHYYAYYGYYVDPRYFGFASAYASSSHDIWLIFYKYLTSGAALTDSYAAQYYSSLTASNSYNAFFGQ